MIGLIAIIGLIYRLFKHSVYINLFTTREAGVVAIWGLGLLVFSSVFYFPIFTVFMAVVLSLEKSSKHAY